VGLHCAKGVNATLGYFAGVEDVGDFRVEPKPVEVLAFDP